MEASGIIVAGDLSGKECYVIREARGGLEYRDGSRTIGVARENLSELRRKWGDEGRYSIIVSEVPDDATYSKAFGGAKTRRLRQWIDYAGDALSPRGIRLLMIPGNDDSEEVAAALRSEDGVGEDIDERVVLIGEHEVAGFGYSNPTPWRTARELPEEEIARRLTNLGDQIHDAERAVFVIHVPPLGLGIDLAPEVILDPDGGVEAAPGTQVEVGSTAVRTFIEGMQPLVVISGHCHDSPGFAHCGRTLCLNPGSAYNSGTLYGVVLVTEKGRVRGHQGIVR